MFAILVLMALFTTFMTTPTVLAIYKPSRRVNCPPHRRSARGRSVPLQENPRDEIRILACMHGPGNVPALINLVESTRTGKNSPLKLYAMHLVELTDRSSSIMMVQRARKNGVPFVKRFCRGTSNDQLGAAFEAYGHLGRVTIRHSTAISALPTMHDDICHLAEEKGVAMIILPFYKQWREEGEEVMETVGNGWRGVNQRVLESATCSVALFVDRGFGGSSNHEPGRATTTPKRVCILFFGGADDREALKLSGRMAEHAMVSVTVIRFLENGGMANPSNKHENDKELDAAAVEKVKGKCAIEYVEKEVSNIMEEVLTIGASRAFMLLIVGKGGMVANLENHQVEYPELGLVGDILAASHHGIVSSVLVIQHQDTARASENTVSTMARDKEAIVVDAAVTDVESCV